jgi:osmotically inducible lipoprotein OsmB
MKNTFKVLSRSVAVAACVLSLSACSSLDSRTAEYTVGGAAVGAGVGALVSMGSAGCIPCGALVGTAVGAGVGLAADQTQKRY